MQRYVLAFILAGVIGFVDAPAQQPACLHGPKESAAQRDRRTAALDYARQLNTFEAAGKSHAQRFYNIEDLPGLPKLPEGFKASLSTDGASYAFSIQGHARRLSLPVLLRPGRGDLHRDTDTVTVRTRRCLMNSPDHEGSEARRRSDLSLS